MSDAATINADMLSFWNGQGGRIWVMRQAHTDSTLAPVTDALVNFAAPRAGEIVLAVGCALSPRLSARRRLCRVCRQSPWSPYHVTFSCSGLTA